jgi:hypothetical protein
MHQKCGTADNLRPRRNEKERVNSFQRGFEDARSESESPPKASKEKHKEQLYAQQVDDAHQLKRNANFCSSKQQDQRHNYEA